LDVVLDTALEAFIAIDGAGRVTRWNPAAQDTFGYRAADAVGRPIDELIIPPSHRQAHRGGLARLAAGGPSTLLGQRLQLPACHRDGHRLHVELTFAAVATDDGPHYYAFAHDITEQHRAERFRGCELAVSTALSQAYDARHAAAAVLEAIGGTLQWPYAEMWMPDDEAQVLRCVARWSAPGRDFTAFHADQYPKGVGAPGLVWATGEPLWIPDLATDNRSPRSAIAAQAGVHVTLIVPVRSGTKILGVLAFFGEDIEDPQDILIALLTGIAAHVGQYLERRRAEELEVELARTKEQFVAVITHELRNPLAAIVGYSQLLLSDADDVADQHRHDLQLIGRNAERMAALIDDLLDLGQLESGNFRLHLQAVDLCQVVREALDAAHTAAYAKHLRVAGDLPRQAVVEGDATRLRQIIDNLLSNAVKYTADGGRVTVAVACHEPRIVCTVADTGIGIPTAEHERLFTRFYRTSNAVASGNPGTGLGLAVTKALVEHHHGTIDYTSSPGQGTTFTIALPSHQRAPRDPLATERSPQTL
jgi:PAS domain S-box-containing protein